MNDAEMVDVENQEQVEVDIEQSLKDRSEDVFESVDINLIDIGDRAREDFGDLDGLASSIKRIGLLQPLVVTRQEGEKPYLLLAGHRRLKAKILNEDTRTQVRIVPGKLSEIEMMTVELHENFYRKDFEWIELVKLQKKIHDLQQAIHGKKISTLPDASGWGVAETANLVNRSRESVQKDIQLANAVEQFPELFDGCKNKSEASKLMSKIQETLLREELSKRVTENTGSDRLRRISNSYVIGNFFDVAAKMEDSIFNLIEIDPPYSIDLSKVKRQESQVNTQYDLDKYDEITPENYPLFMQTMLKESYRLAKEHAWMIVWFGPEPWFEDMFRWITEAGWNTTRMVGIWTKGHGQSLNPNTRLANSFEMFYYAWKGQPALAKPGTANDFRFPPVPPQHKYHPTQRPMELMTSLYSTFAFEGSRVLIPCAGSGVGILAAEACKMSAVATDINPAYKEPFILEVDNYLKGGI